MESVKLTQEDHEDRVQFEEILEIMKLQGVVGETQPEDYADAIWYSNNLEAHNLKDLPEGNIADHFDTIIFDFDGVLYNSAPAIYRAVLLMLQYYKAHHIEIPESHEDVANSFSSPAMNYFRRFGIRFSTPKEAVDFREHYLTVVKPSIESEFGIPDLHPEVKEVLEEIQLAKAKNPHLKVTVLSAGRVDEVIPNLERLGIRDYFDEIKVDQADKKEAISTIIGSADPSRAIMIGDLPSDIRDAQAITGVKTIAVARGERERERLGHYLPDYIVSDLKELWNLKKYLVAQK
jgi:phosphoglycolate phosphatase-like HAD superfamily hydrolase